MYINEKIEYFKNVLINQYNWLILWKMEIFKVFSFFLVSSTLFKNLKKILKCVS